MSNPNSGSSRSARPNKNTNKNTNPKSNKNTRSSSAARRAAQSRASARSTATPATAPTRFRSRHPVITALVPVGLVVAAVATMVVIKASGNSNPPAAASSHLAAGAGAANAADTGATALSPAVVAALTVPTATLNAVGSPTTDALPSKTGSSSILKGADGKPLITYIGAEYCPFCAAERWSLAVALSRFGTFSNLSGTHSSDSDVYPDTQTLSFYGSSYTSPYVDFQAVEEATNQPVGGSYATLQTPTAAQSALLAKYDAAGTIPFLDIGNRYIISNASYSPQVLQGLSRSQIAAQLNDPSSAVAQAIDGTANDITAAIVAVTGNQPTSVSSSATITAIVQKLGA